MAAASPSPLPLLSAALIAGAYCGGPSPRLSVAIGIGLASLAVAIVARRRWAAILFVALTAFSAGAAAQRIAWRAYERAELRILGGAPRVETEIVGLVGSVPERRLDGTYALRLEALVPGDGRPARIRLEVAAPHGAEAERLAALRSGDLVAVWCSLRAPAAGPRGSRNDARRRLIAQRIDAEGRVKSSRLVRQLRTGDGSPSRLLDELHARAVRRLDRTLGRDARTRAVVAAMLLGDRGLLDDEVERLLRDAGLVHIVSISGLHTAMSVVVLITLLRGAGLRAGGLAILGLFALPALAALVGHGAAVWRACGCLAVVLAARAVGRTIDALAALALAAGALVVVWPGLAWNVGFVLSVVATAGLLEASRGVRRGFVRRSLAASTGAYAATLPLIVQVFGRAAPVALLANLAAAPLCAACIGTGLAVVLGTGRAGAWAAERAVEALVEVSRLAAMVPGGHLRAARPALWLHAVFLATALAWLYVPSATQRTRRLLALAATLLALAIHLGPPPPSSSPVRVEVLDVGQGLSVVLRGQDGTCAMYDAGPGAARFDAGDRIVLPALAALGCGRLDVLMISHDHDDHAGGAFAVLRDYEVGAIWVAEGTAHDPATSALVAAAIERGVAVRRLRRGEVLRTAGFELDVLHPGVADRHRPVNDRCLAVRARTASGASLMLPGDLEAAGERALLEGGARAAADVLLAPHHGSNGSSTAAFVGAVGARDVIVSVGAGNRFGHPGAAALERYAAAGVRVWRTDRDGTIVLVARGVGWRVSARGDRDRDEREDEDGSEHDRDHDASRPERRTLVDQPRVAAAQEEEDREPERIARGRLQREALEDDPRTEHGDRQP